MNSIETMFTTFSGDAVLPVSLDPSLVWWAPIVAFALAVAVFMLASYVFGRATAQPVRDVDPLDAPPSEGIFGPLTPALAAQLPESEKETRDFKKLLRTAGMYESHSLTTIYALRFVLLFVPLVTAGVFAVLADDDYTWPIMIAGGLAAGGLSIVPRLYVFFRRRARQRRIRRGLADTIDMLSMCIDGGLGFHHSLSYVADQLTNYPVLAEELRILKRQAEVGSIEQALEDFSARLDMPEIRQLSALLGRGTRLGTQLSGSLMNQADHLRTRRRQQAMLQANKTPAKLVLPLMFCFAPAALILLTSPALLELKEFLVPTDGVAVSDEGAVFGTGDIVDTMRGLNQEVPTSGLEQSFQP
ncbi:MAG: type II secretion system F family protein [Pirellulales bacterium]